MDKVTVALKNVPWQVWGVLIAGVGAIIILNRTLDQTAHAADSLVGEQASNLPSTLKNIGTSLGAGINAAVDSTLNPIFDPLFNWMKSFGGTTTADSGLGGVGVSKVDPSYLASISQSTMN